MLKVIRFAEGTDGIDGYRTLVGGKLFNSYDDHPRIFVKITMKGVEYTSSAAGAYQFLSRTWDGLVDILKLKDFSPENQILGAIQLLDECGSLLYLEKDRFDEAIYKANRIWASLPGSPYGQPVKSIERCREVYKANGGKIVTAI